MKSQADQETLERILDESRGIRGVSLWQDAWNRLRRNRTSMVSLYCLIVLAVLAMLTPLLPLQSPIDKDLNNRRFLPPNFQSVVMGSRPGLKFEGGTLTGQVAAFESALDELRAQRDKTNDTTEKLKLTQTIEQKTVVEHPFNQMWNELGPVTWWMCETRVAVFGNYSLPSVFGTDKLGRDLLARVFWGARVSLIVGIVATLVSLIIGVSYGAIAATETTTGGVAYLAHVGGFAAGVIAALILRPQMGDEPDSVLHRQYERDPRARRIW